MCLPNFKKFQQIEESNPIIGYRNWILNLKNPKTLISEHMDYWWDKVVEGPHSVLSKDSGIYSYNNKYSYYNNNYYNYYYNNYYNYYNNNYYYNITGIIYQYGKVAIHKDGYRSEYAKIKTLYTIRESDAIGPREFLVWIETFNTLIRELAIKYEADTMHWQDIVNNGL